MQITPILVFNAVVLVFFVLAFFYQFVYIFITLRYKQHPVKPARRLHSYAFVICAHNEGAVISELVRSIKEQDYPSELIDTYVFCDNCTDDTAQLAREAGAIVLERPGGGQKGKSWVMDYGLSHVLKEHPGKYEAFFVFDADNVLSKTYVTEMNKVFDMGGFAAITSFRNSKNFDSSWVSRGYGTWFIREATYLNNARMILGTSCAISGTGYLISADMIERMHGWDFHLLTEDIQFSVFCAVNGYRIGYAHKAVFYDEQPVTFSASWKQRMRWTKGFYQVFAKYASALFNTWFKGPKNRVAPDVKEGRSWRFAAYDMTMTIAPAMILTIVSAAVNGIYRSRDCGTHRGQDVPGVVLRHVCDLLPDVFPSGPSHHGDRGQEDAHDAAAPFHEPLHVPGVHALLCAPRFGGGRQEGRLGAHTSHHLENAL